NPAGRVRSFNTGALIRDERLTRQLSTEKDYLLLKRASASRPSSGSQLPWHGSLATTAFPRRRVALAPRPTVGQWDYEDRQNLCRVRLNPPSSSSSRGPRLHKTDRAGLAR